MNAYQSRRFALVVTATVLIASHTVFAQQARRAQTPSSRTTVQLPIPPLMDLTTGAQSNANAGVSRGSLVAQVGTHEFVPGASSETMGYNGGYLGPTIVVERGGQYEIAVRNNLSDTTSVHWHGMDIEAAADGGPHQTIGPGDSWVARFGVHQTASTGWYHPHAMGTTAVQVAHGLAGMIIVRDSSTPALRTQESQLPHRYGIDDIPLIIQDRRLDARGVSAFRLMMPDVMHGFRGNVLVTNGVIEPTHALPRGLVRLRVLNGSNSAYLRLDFPAELRARVIASDGGYLREPVAIDSLVVAAAERYEVVIDTRALTAGEEPLWINATSDAGVSMGVLGITVAAAGADSGTATVRELPTVLIGPAPIIAPGTDDSTLPRRNFVIETRGMMTRTPFTINGRAMDMNRIDERIGLGVTEIWTIENRGPMQMTHTFHLHSTHFQVLRVNGRPADELIAGRKDTVILAPGARVEIAVRFERHAGLFMYHCHMLEHEESGLMGQILVGAPPGQSHGHQ